MIRLFVILVAGVLMFASVPGCGGGSGESKNVVQDADQAAIQAYEEAVAKEGAEMTEEE